MKIKQLKEIIEGLKTQRIAQANAHAAAHAEQAERIEKLEREKQLHAGDTLSLSNELDEWKERAQDAERALAEAVGYVDKVGLKMFREGTLKTLLMHRQKGRVNYVALYAAPQTKEPK